jgi:hypothetical protein
VQRTRRNPAFPSHRAALASGCPGFDQETLESIRAAQQREAEGDPTKPEVFLLWDRAQLLSALQVRIDAKDQNWKGGPYERYVLVIHTDEFSLDRDTVARFLQGATFQTQLLTDVFLESLI